MTNPFSLHGRRALVTGANTGIGHTIAMGLANAGATVVCTGRSASDETVDRITKAGGTAALCHVDFADPMAAQGMFADQNFDILINNTGIITRSDAVEATEADWSTVMDVNLKSLFFTTQAFWQRVLCQRPAWSRRQHCITAVLSGRHPCGGLHGLKARRCRADKDAGQ